MEPQQGIDFIKKIRKLRRDTRYIPKARKAPAKSKKKEKTFEEQAALLTPAQLQEMIKLYGG